MPKIEPFQSPQVKAMLQAPSISFQTQRLLINGVVWKRGVYADAPGGIFMTLWFTVTLFDGTPITELQATDINVFHLDNVVLVDNSFNGPLAGGCDYSYMYTFDPSYISQPFDFSNNPANIVAGHSLVFIIQISQVTEAFTLRSGMTIITTEAPHFNTIAPG